MKEKELAKWLFENRAPLVFGFRKYYKDLIKHDKKEMRKMARKIIEMFEKGNSPKVILEQSKPFEVHVLNGELH